MIIPIGIDISKAKLDICKDGEFFSCENTAQAIKELFSQWQPHDCRVVLEATGKYHRLAHDMLDEMGYAVMVINPYQARHFAKAMNVLCKTDRVDAKILSLFALHMEFFPTQALRGINLELQELWRHHADLQGILNQVEARQREASGRVLKSLGRVVIAIKKEIATANEALKKIVKTDVKLREKVKLLKSIPGIGETTAIALLCGLKELGNLSKTEIAALAGLAPVNNDSGTKCKKRTIRGGRHDIRSQLYMPIVGAATRHNERLKIFYNKLLKNNKVPKIALTACMRKMVIWANAVLQTGKPWQENYV